MDNNRARQPAGRADRGDSWAFDLIAAKLMRPLTRDGTVRRALLIDRLRRDGSRPIVSVVAPAGYGKTTLLSQWAERNGQAFAWVSVDEKDNDPKVLLTYVAEALDAVQPIGGRVFDALASPASSVPGSVVPRLSNAFASMTSPVALVLDDVHMLHDSECRAALSVLADHVPTGSRLVLASRDEPPLRVARLRVEGKILEIGPGDLSLTPAEAASLLRAAGVTLGQEDVARLHRQTEGWPVGLYLAALYLRQGGSLPRGAGAFGGDDRFMSDYLESEFLARMSPAQRTFLTRTAVLDRMCGPLCEAVLEIPGSGTVLAELARSNLLLVPLDRRGHWHRYHHLFRDMLRAELERLEPGLIPVLRRRAAQWCLQNELPEEALEYSMAAGDVATAGRVVERLGRQVYNQGRVTTVQRWARWLDERDAIGGRPLLAAWVAILAACTGRPAEADRWADTVDRWQNGDGQRPADPAAEAWAAVVRAMLCRLGAEQMRTDADESARRLAAANIVAPVAALMRGIARVLCGDLEAGDECFKEGISAGDAGAPDILAVALCQRALLAIRHDQWALAEDLAGQAGLVLRRARIEDSYATPLACAIRARAAWHRGDVATARHELIRAQRLRPLLTYALPHLAVQTRVELVGVYLALADHSAVRTLMREVDDLLRRRPGLGTLVGDVQALRTRLARDRDSSAPGASALTAAELRLLPLLTTHMSLPEIAAQLSLSQNTVKSQAYSLYRKLGATSRSQAIARSRELTLLEPA
jgi:LuxR family transcriptional regulator, maltose regulon positive regulatory protein